VYRVGCLFAALADILWWLEEVLEAMAVILETKRYGYMNRLKGRRLEYQHWYCSASAAPDWTACGGRAGTSERPFNKPGFGTGPGCIPACLGSVVEWFMAADCQFSEKADAILNKET
jgi:hypothetical protein